MKNQISDIARLNHIVEAIDEIHNYIALCDYDEFIMNSMMRNATVRQLEIIGEASGHLSEEFRTNNSDIDWDAITGMRNIIVHEYFGINYDIVWNTIQSDLDGLYLKVNEILSEK